MRVTHYKNYRNRQTKRYHVAYNFSCFNGNYGFGHTEINLNGRFSIEEVTNYIKSLNTDFKDLAIISWQKKMQ